MFYNLSVENLSHTHAYIHTLYHKSETLGNLHFLIGLSFLSLSPPPSLPFLLSLFNLENRFPSFPILLVWCSMMSEIQASSTSLLCHVKVWDLRRQAPGRTKKQWTWLYEFIHVCLLAIVPGSCHITFCWHHWVRIYFQWYPYLQWRQGNVVCRCGSYVHCWILELFHDERRGES